MKGSNNTENSSNIKEFRGEYCKGCNGEGYQDGDSLKNECAALCDKYQDCVGKLLDRMTGIKPS